VLLPLPSSVTEVIAQVRIWSNPALAVGKPADGNTSTVFEAVHPLLEFVTVNV
jgi:hypothetical protein